MEVESERSKLVTIARVKHPKEVNVTRSNQGTDVLLPFLGGHVLGKKPLSGKRETPTLSDRLVHSTMVFVPFNYLQEFDTDSRSKTSKTKQRFHLLMGVEEREAMCGVLEGDTGPSASFDFNVLQRSLVNTSSYVLDNILVKSSADTQNGRLGFRRGQRHRSTNSRHSRRWQLRLITVLTILRRGKGRHRHGGHILRLLVVSWIAGKRASDLCPTSSLGKTTTMGLNLLNSTAVIADFPVVLFVHLVHKGSRRLLLDRIVGAGFLEPYILAATRLSVHVSLSHLFIPDKRIYQKHG